MKNGVPIPTRHGLGSFIKKIKNIKIIQPNFETPPVSKLFAKSVKGFLNSSLLTNYFQEKLFAGFAFPVVKFKASKTKDKR